MSHQGRYDGGYLPTGGMGTTLTPGTDLTALVTVTPALVLAARRGFVDAMFNWFVDGGDQAASFFDDQAGGGSWTPEFYRYYAELDPEKEAE